MDKRTLKRSFLAASSGLFYLLSTHRHFLMEILFSGFVIALGILLRISYYEWLTILSLVMIGLIIEMLNTSIEELGNAITTNFHPEIKKAKDVAGGAVFLFIIFSTILALMIFIPKILTRLA